MIKQMIVVGLLDVSLTGCIVAPYDDGGRHHSGYDRDRPHWNSDRDRSKWDRDRPNRAHENHFPNHRDGYNHR